MDDQAPRLRAAMVAAFGLVSAAPAAARDMMRSIDLTSPEMTTAEQMTRGDVEAAIAAATSDHPADFSGKSFQGLDLSGLDLFGAVLRADPVNKTQVAGAKLDRAISIRLVLEAISDGQASRVAAFRSAMRATSSDGPIIGRAHHGRSLRRQPGGGPAHRRQISGRHEEISPWG